MILTQALSLEAKTTLSLVGAGGKTSVMFALAAELAAKGACVLVTTTTAIRHPDLTRHAYHHLMRGKHQNVIDYAPQPGQVIVAARSEVPETGKLLGYLPEAVDAIHRNGRFDYILVEADGSRGRPVKAPAKYEPAVPSCTQISVGVVGLDCIGKPLTATFAHRPERLATVTGSSAYGIISEELVTSLVLAPQGLFNKSPTHSRRIVVLNKADKMADVERGRILAQKICRACPRLDRVLVCCLKRKALVRAVACSIQESPRSMHFS